MVHRCVMFFKGAGDKGFLWIQYLNMTRMGSNEAPTIAQKLWELAGNNETFCQNLSEDIALLCQYTGLASSAWSFLPTEKRPSPADAAPGRTKPQDSYLTCLAMNRECGGTNIENGRCWSWCKTKAGKTSPEPDECYWIQEKLQIHTYQDALHYYGTLP